MKLFTLGKDVRIEDLQLIHPALLILFTRVVMFTQEHDLSLRITSIVRDRKAVRSVSNTHSEGRAIDIGVRNWPIKKIHKLVNTLNVDYSDIAAISAKTKKPRAALYHNNHIHIQVRPNANVNRFIKEELWNRNMH